MNTMSTIGSRSWVSSGGVDSTAAASSRDPKRRVGSQPDGAAALTLHLEPKGAPGPSQCTPSATRPDTPLGAPPISRGHAPSALRPCPLLKRQQLCPLQDSVHHGCILAAARLPGTRWPPPQGAPRPLTGPGCGDTKSSLKATRGWAEGTRGPLPADLALPLTALQGAGFNPGHTGARVAASKRVQRTLWG